MLFTHALPTLVLIGLFVVIPAIIVHFSRRHISRLVEFFKAGHHRS